MGVLVKGAGDVMVSFQVSALWWVLPVVAGSIVLTGIWAYCRSLSDQARTGLLSAFSDAGTLSSDETKDVMSDFATPPGVAGMYRHAGTELAGTGNEVSASPATWPSAGQICPDHIDLRALRSMPLVRGARGTVIAKAIIDIVASAMLILFMLPLMVISAVLIKLESRGPVFYRQVRVGKDGRNFNILKFRSMHMDAEKSGPCWARQNDCRVTRIGAFLRRSRIDEIPQALNVLAGQMSFVGPRPERPEFVADLREKVPHFEERLSVKPGITGWAQVNYPYGASVEDAAKKLRYDLFYIQNYSFLFDILIVIKTIRVALTGLGSR